MDAGIGLLLGAVGAVVLWTGLRWDLLPVKALGGVALAGAIGIQVVAAGARLPEVRAEDGAPLSAWRSPSPASGESVGLPPGIDFPSPSPSPSRTQPNPPKIKPERQPDPPRERTPREPRQEPEPAPSPEPPAPSPRPSPDPTTPPPTTPPPTTPPPTTSPSPQPTGTSAEEGS